MTSRLRESNNVPIQIIALLYRQNAKVKRQCCEFVDNVDLLSSPNELSNVVISFHPKKIHNKTLHKASPYNKSDLEIRRIFSSIIFFIAYH